MLQKIKKRNQGFTIIEVLIVLAIAGLIMLIVFLAVPALQRNARNTQRKQDVANTLSAVNEWTNNNQGVIPQSGTDLTSALKNVKLGYYTSSNITWGSGTVSNTTDAEHVEVVSGATCASNNDDSVAGSPRQVVALYTVETGGGTDHICQGS